jgi:hypothetical protein
MTARLALSSQLPCCLGRAQPGCSALGFRTRCTQAHLTHPVPVRRRRRGGAGPAAGRALPRRRAAGGLQHGPRGRGCAPAASPGYPAVHEDCIALCRAPAPACAADPGCRSAMLGTVFNTLCCISKCWGAHGRAGRLPEDALDLCEVEPLRQEEPDSSVWVPDELQVHFSICSWQRTAASVRHAGVHRVSGWASEEEDAGLLTGVWVGCRRPRLCG